MSATFLKQPLAYFKCNAIPDTMNIRQLQDTLLALRTNSAGNAITLSDRIAAGIAWLLKAQKATKDGGVSARYSLVYGWASSYPETTGYIIPTILDYSEAYNQPTLTSKALEMAEWEISIQQADGSFIGGACEEPVGKLVFDTGQILFGLVRAYLFTKDEKFLQAAIKAGDWLCSIQSEDGCWIKHSFNTIPHSYHSRVAWAIARLFETTGEDKYKQTVYNHADWVISNQLTNGWFQYAGFTEYNSLAPYTHTIAYTIRGLLEIGIIFNDSKYINAAKTAADRILTLISSEGYLWGAYDREWNTKGKFICLTGNAQMVIILLKLFSITNDKKYYNGAKNLNSYLKKRQYLGSRSSNIFGAIGGSWPIWGEYERLSYPNWATKFFVDALILEDFLSKDKKLPRALPFA